MFEIKTQKPLIEDYFLSNLCNIAQYYCGYTYGDFMLYGDKSLLIIFDHFDAHHAEWVIEYPASPAFDIKKYIKSLIRLAKTREYKFKMSDRFVPYYGAERVR